MPFKNTILQIIAGPIQSEPIYLLELEYKKLFTDNERQDFVDSVKSIAISGSKKERFACITFLILINKADECELILKENIHELNLHEDIILLPALLSLSEVIKKEWSLNFIKSVIFEFKSTEDKSYYLYKFAIRSLIIADHWLDLIEEINTSLSKNETLYFIDFFAFFKWKKENELDKLLYNLSKENLEKYNILRKEIDKRYLSNYIS